MGGNLDSFKVRFAKDVDVTSLPIQKIKTSCDSFEDRITAG